MDVIPVIDVAQGRVVRAARGDRANYKPIETRLAAGSDPASIARGYKSLFPFRRIYVADLDGIEGRGRNVHLVPAISSVFRAPKSGSMLERRRAARRARCWQRR